MATRNVDEAVAYGLQVGRPQLRSVGPIAFGPASILFVADSASATIVAIAVGDVAAPAEASRSLDVERLDERLAAYLGCTTDDVDIRGMAVDPATQAVYLSVMRGRGIGAIPVIVRVGEDGLDELSLSSVPFAQVAIADAPAEDDERKDTSVLRDSDPGGETYDARGTLLRLARENLRTVTVTGMAYVGGMLVVAGASNEEFSSTLRQIPFPFGGAVQSSSLEIFHVSHGKYETASPIRSFVAYDDDMSVLASYTCTPVVTFSLRDLRGGEQAHGRTVAELGAMNTPLGMVAFRRDGEEFLLVSNSRHELFRMSRRDLQAQEALTEPREPVGAPRVALPQQGVGRMALLNSEQVLMLQRDEAGRLHLHSYRTDSL